MVGDQLLTRAWSENWHDARDLEEALREMSESDLLRLRAVAQLHARGLPGGISWSDLLHEAILRSLDGSRRWPLDLALPAFLAGVMRSLREDHWRRYRHEASLVLDRRATRLDDDDRSIDPERRFASVQALADLNRLFASDTIALQILSGIAAGLVPEEIRTFYGIAATDYDTARRRIRRSLLRQGLAWSGR